ncbi:MAG: hypothetical protein FWF51_09410 [Chitinivibrionia bacterium]|nr:hypothetical protein [Chitinivibrionia bacterium]
MLKNVVLILFAFASFAFSAGVLVEEWNANKAYKIEDIVVYKSEAYFAKQNVSAGNVPDQSNIWKKIVDYSNPKDYKQDLVYDIGDITKYNGEIYVARHWVSNTHPNKNDPWGAWIFINNYAPITTPKTGPIAKLPPHPGAAGKKTILGIDSDGDGIRDDIQIAVTKLIPDDPYVRAGVLFPLVMQQELWKVVLNNPNESFEFYYPHLLRTSAGVHYSIETGAEDIFPYEKRAILLYNTKERFLISEKLDSIANGHGFMAYDYYPDLKEKYDREFKEMYEREMERQK